MLPSANVALGPLALGQHWKLLASAHHLIKPHYCRYRRSGKYHDKSVNALHVSDNGYIITASLGSKYDHDDDFLLT